MRQTISDLNKTIEIMRKIYPFKDEDTQIWIVRDPWCNNDKLNLLTTDKDTDTEVLLTRIIETEGDKRENGNIKSINGNILH